MFKFAILSVVLIVTQASLIDNYLGKSLSVAIFPKLEDVDIGCNWYTAKIVNSQCVCGDGENKNTNVNLLSFRYIPDNGTEYLFAISVVNTTAEVEEALTKYAKCKCEGKDYGYAVYRPVNDKFYAQYMMNPADEKTTVAELAAGSEATKHEIENIIQTIDDLKNKKYEILCQ